VLSTVIICGFCFGCDDPYKDYLGTWTSDGVCAALLNNGASYGSPIVSGLKCPFVLVQRNKDSEMILFVGRVGCTLDQPWPTKDGVTFLKILCWDEEISADENAPNAGTVNFAFPDRRRMTRMTMTLNVRCAAEETKRCSPLKDGEQKSLLYLLPPPT